MHHPELGERERDRHAAPLHAEALEVDRERAALQALGHRAGIAGELGATEQRRDARQQVRQAHVLGEIVVRAQPQARDRVEIAVARGEEDDRQRGRQRAQLPAKCEAAVDVGAQADVDQRQVGQPRLHRGERLGAPGIRRDFEAVLAQSLRVVGANGRLVLDDRDAARHGGDYSRRAPPPRPLPALCQNCSPLCPVRNARAPGTECPMAPWKATLRRVSPPFPCLRCSRSPRRSASLRPSCSPASPCCSPRRPTPRKDKSPTAACCSSGRADSRAPRCYSPKPSRTRTAICGWWRRITIRSASRWPACISIGCRATRCWSTSASAWAGPSRSTQSSLIGRPRRSSSALLRSRRARPSWWNWNTAAAARRGDCWHWVKRFARYWLFSAARASVP